MSKVKMRCTVCGKWFQSANAKEVTCPDCVQKARKDKLAAKNAPPSANKSAGATNIAASGTTRATVPPPKSKQHVQSGTNQWLDKLDDVKISTPEQPPARPKFPSPPVQRDQRTGQNQFRTPGDLGFPGTGQGNAGNQSSAKPYPYRRDDNERTPGYSRGPANYRPGAISSTIGQRPRAPQQGGPERGSKPPYMGGKGGPRGKGKPSGSKPPAPPKPPREKIPPPPPFVPTPEQIKQVEERYVELAQPIEFDGIRTQIAHELHIPKKAVKKIVKDIRLQSHIPSWWELQTYKGSKEELDRIKAVYEPYLPVPPVGVHKLIADQLSIKPSVAYQAIKTIRNELSLPQYNDPSLHEQELPQSDETGNENTPVSEQPEGEGETAQTTEAVQPIQEVIASAESGTEGSNS
jgi:hypothetical protein